MGRMDEIDAILEQFVAQGQNTEHKILGASFVVTTPKEAIYSGAAGRLGPDNDSAPFSADSFTYVASLTKIITVTCLMQLVERGDVKLDDDLRATIPELSRMQILRGFDAEEKSILEQNNKPITLRMLLTHTVGLAYDLADADLMKWSHSIGRKDTNLDWSKAGFTTPLKFAPGDGWCYGTAIDWAGLLLQKVTGQTIGEYMKTNIFSQLGMKDTTFWPDKSVKSRTATCTYRQKDGSLAGGALPVRSEHELESGGAGLFTTASDYSAFQQALMAGKLVRKDTVTRMFSPQLDDEQRSSLKAQVYHSPATLIAYAPEFPMGLPIDHGFGGVINMQDVAGKRRKGNMMWSGMCNSHWWIDPQIGIGAVLIVNVLPHGDEVVGKLYDTLERAVYRILSSTESA